MQSKQSSCESNCETDREIQSFPTVTEEKVRNITSDVIIFLHDYKFPAHKLVLYYKSGYFRDIILKNKEKSLSQIELEPNIAVSAFKIIYDFMYTDELKIEHDEFEEVLITATKLQVHGVSHKMLEFVEKSFDVSNVLFIYDYVKNVDDLELKAKVNFLVTSNFMHIAEQLEFVKIPVEILIRILDDDGISVASELDVFRSTIRWLAYDWAQRKFESLRIMEKIRFSIMSQEELLTCYHEMERWGIIEMGQMKDNMIAILRYKMGQQVGTPLSITSSFNFRRRNTMAEKMNELVRINSSVSDLNMCSKPSTFNLKVKNSPSILILGGCNFTDGNDMHSNNLVNRNCSVGNSMYHYVPGDSSWKSAGLLPLPWHHPGTAYSDDLVYICGGSVPCDNLLTRSPKITTMTWCFHVTDRLWQRLPDMSTARVYHAVLLWNEKLYAIGGINDNNEFLDSVECYDPLIDKWEMVSKIPNARLAMAASCYQDIFWVCGGIIRSGKDQLNGGMITNSAFAYSPKKNKWWSLTPLRVPRAFATFTVLNGRLLLVGGIQDDSRGNGSSASISDVDVYDLQRNEWHHLTDLFTPRHCCSAVSLGRFLYVIGGISLEGDALCTIEIFDSLRNSSPTFGVNLPLKLAGMGSVVLSPANA
ncbi:hypothetical protein CHUAL_014076 [Chamberlinius hualienensis]